MGDMCLCVSINSLSYIFPVPLSLVKFVTVAVVSTCSCNTAVEGVVNSPMAVLSVH